MGRLVEMPNEDITGTSSLLVFEQNSVATSSGKRTKFYLAWNLHGSV
jgi:hypothetical protein